MAELKNQIFQMTDSIQSERLLKIAYCFLSALTRKEVEEA